MANNLNELNDVLFDTLRGVKEGTIDDKKAQTVTNVANSIINNAKMQLSAYKLTKGRAYSETFGSIPSGEKALESGDRYDLMNEYAMHEGFKSISQAMEKLGKQDFINQFESWLAERGG